MSIPLQIYDFLAVLFPAVVVVTVIRVELPHETLAFLASGNSYGGLAVSLVLLYLLGQAVTIVSRHLERGWARSLLKKRRVRRESRPGSESIRNPMIELQGRKIKVAFREPVARAILAAVEDVYGVPVAANSSDLFQLVYGPVQDRIPKRDMFLALANMMRDLTLICVGVVAVLILQFAAHLYIPAFWRVSDYVLAATATCGFWTFRAGYHSHTYTSELIPFTEFLAWYKTRKMA